MKKKLVLLMCLSLVIVCSNFHASFASEKTTLNFLTKPYMADWGNWSENLIWVKGDNQALYLDKNGKITINVKESIEKSILADLGQDLYKEHYPNGISVEDFELGDFREGIVTTSYVGSSTYFNKLGNVVLESDYYGYDFSEGVAFLSGPLATESFIVDNKGNIKTLDTNRDWEVYWNKINEDLFIFQPFLTELNGLKGYRDKNLKLVISPQFEDARPFNQGLAFVKKDGKWGIIDKNANFVINPQFEDFKVEFKDYKIFHNDLAAVKKNGKWGYINKSGKTIIDYLYDDAEVFYEGLASIKLNGKWGVVNTSGNLVSDFYWDKISSFLNGYAFGKIDGKYGYINALGELIIDIKFTDANYFSNGVALVKCDGLYRLIDTKGNFISDDKWYFEGSSTNRNNPEMIMYKYDGLWGIAKISPEGIKGISVDSKPEAYSNLSDLVFTKYKEYEGSNGIFYTITNKSNAVDNGRKAVLISSLSPELHLIEYNDLKPGESVSGHFQTQMYGKYYIEESNKNIICINNKLDYDIFLEGVVYQSSKKSPFSTNAIPEYLIDDSQKGREWIEKYFGVKRTGPEGKYPSN